MMNTQHNFIPVSAPTVDALPTHFWTPTQTPFTAIQIPQARETTVSRVPRDLIPTKKNGRAACHIQWAKRTYQYFHLFDSNISSLRSEDHDELLAWIDHTIGIQNQLKEWGCYLAKKEVLKLAVEEFDKELSSCQKPTNLNDLLSIFGNTTWYGQNTARKRDMIYMLSFGLFRMGYNTWAIEAERQWLTSHNLAYKEKTPQDRSRKGFVYMLLVHRASDMLSKQIQHVMKRVHNEWLVVRKWKQDPQDHLPFRYHYTDHNYRRCQYSVCRVEGTNEHQRNLHVMVEAARVKGIQREDILKIINNIYKPDERSAGYEMEYIPDTIQQRETTPVSEMTTGTWYLLCIEMYKLPALWTYPFQ